MTTPEIWKWYPERANEMNKDDVEDREIEKEQDELAKKFSTQVS